MNAGSTSALLLSFACCALACEKPSVDPPPPPSRHEIPAAPPDALGAHAASSPVAPQLIEHQPSDSEGGDSESEEGAVPGPDAGTDAGARVPEPEGVAL